MIVARYGNLVGIVINEYHEVLQCDGISVLIESIAEFLLPAYFTWDRSSSFLRDLARA